MPPRDLRRIQTHFEDETGAQFSFAEMGPILTGDSDARLFPAGTKDYEVEYAFAENEPINLGDVAIGEEQRGVLGYFSRDLGELLSTALFREGPGTITKAPGDDTWTLETAVTQEEVRSFVTVFRRLYMESEPANLQKAATIFSKVFSDHPIARWVTGAAEECWTNLAQAPNCIPSGKGKPLGFSRKRLIDVFLYTQFAHQPNEQRIRQFHECLAAVGNDEQLLTWMFLSEVWRTAVLLANHGKVIRALFQSFTESTAMPAAVSTSVLTGNPAVGALETKRERTTRLFNEKQEKLARENWRNAGSPEGDFETFVTEAREQLLAKSGKSEDDVT